MERKKKPWLGCREICWRWRLPGCGRKLVGEEEQCVSAVAEAAASVVELGGGVAAETAVVASADSAASDRLFCAAPCERPPRKPPPPAATPPSPSLAFQSLWFQSCQQFQAPPWKKRCLWRRG